MAKSTKKVNVKNDAKDVLMKFLEDQFADAGITVFDNDDFTAKLTASTLVVDINGVDVKVVLTTPKGPAEDTRYEREDGVVIETSTPAFEDITEDVEA